jgi:hypothetical protein
MAKTSSLALLIKSLTKAEKRYFKLYSSVQEGSKNYITLFNIFDKLKDMDELKVEFQKKMPGASFEITSKYLYELLMDSLVHLKNKDNDEVVRMNHTLSMVKILFEKSLYNEVFSELAKLKKFAIKKGNNLMLLNASIIEMDYIKQINFLEVTENDLIQHQMKIGALIKSVSHAHQHSSLYALLKHRMIYRGSVRTIRQKQELNDLVVSEMSLMSHPSANFFEASKTHLLFQSTYCLIVGDYKSALSAFYELNQLFEDNTDIWKDSVIDYLSCLEGILNSLHTIKRYHEIDHYLEKVKKLDDGTIYFNTLKYSLIFIYKAAACIFKGQYTEALALIKEYDEILFKRAHLLSFNKQAELYLNISLIHFENKDLSLTVKYLNKVLLDNSIYYKLPEYKTLRLIRLLAQYELGNHEFIKYEISFFKRYMSAKDKTYKLEKLLFKFLQNTYQHLSLKSRMAIWEKTQLDFEKLRSDKFEIQILKIFDFATWVEAKLFKKSFTTLIKEHNLSTVTENQQVLQ